MSWLIHFFCYYLAWINCVLLAGKNMPYRSSFVVLLILFFQILLQSIIRRPWVDALVYGIALMVVGMIIDTMWLFLGLIDYNANPLNPYFSPPWIAFLWLSFGFNLITLSQRLIVHTFLFGLLTFPSIILAYWLGAKLGAAVLNSHWFYIMLGGVWSLIIPLSLNLFNHFRRDFT
ncbi:DUF2878 family protein [Legionella hackeliae]|nr:DUF2878 family protein [Legionella hackeliae]